MNNFVIGYGINNFLVGLILFIGVSVLSVSLGWELCLRNKSNKDYEKARMKRQREFERLAEKEKNKNGGNDG